jgi:hypothetical protein
MSSSTPTRLTTTAHVNVVYSSRPQGVSRIATMDNDDETLVELLMKVEVDGASDGEDRLMIFVTSED